MVICGIDWLVTLFPQPDSPTMPTISSAPKTPDAVGKTVQEYADFLGKDAFDTYFDLLLENNFTCMASYFSLSEQDMLTIYQSPYSMIGSDTICSEKKGPAHPRAYGSFIKPIAEGIVSVYIGGELVYDGKNITEARPGKCLL